VLELSKFNVPVEEVKTARERRCYFLKHGTALDLATLPATLEDPMIRQALEVLMKISQEERERQWAMEWERIRMDDASLRGDLLAAREEAREEARLAHEKGIAIGQRIGRIQLLQQLLAQPETSREELARLEEQDLVQLEDSLKRQLSGPKLTNGTPPTDPT